MRRDNGNGSRSLGIRNRQALTYESPFAFFLVLIANDGQYIKSKGAFDIMKNPENMAPCYTFFVVKTEPVEEP
jgi:hypothetical protein